MNDREDLVITRVVDRTASHDDWVALEELGRSDPTVWDRLHGALQDDLLLRKALGPTFELADSIELPRVPMPVPLGRFLAPAGWLAALILALLWIGTSGLFGRGQMIGPQGDDDLEGTPVGANQRKPAAVVLEELPPDVLGWSPREDGSVEMVWLRQTVESAIVDTVYRMAEDELGNPRPTQVNVNKLKPPRVY